MTGESPATLVLKRTIHAPAAAVFAAWTKPELISKWFIGDDAASCEVIAAELRIGGAYDFKMTMISGEVNQVRGVYREIIPDEKLVFTWAWNSTPERVSLVTVNLKAKGNETLLVLTHEHFADQAARDNHAKGWTACLERLESHFVP